jgi:hypothetical protein
MSVTGTKDSVEHRLSCMIAAHSAVSRRLNDMQCPKDPVLMADLFDTITAAASSCGCEVWSTPFLAGWHPRNCTLSQRFQATVYKQALKLPRSTYQQPAGVLVDGTVPYADTMAAAHAELLEQVGC